MIAGRAPLGRLLDAAVWPVAWYLQDRKMERFGIHRTMALAQRYNRMRHGRYHEWRVAEFRRNGDRLLEENGKGAAAVEMQDGWALDASRTAPHLEAMIHQAEQIIAERGKRGGRGFGKSFFQDLWHDEDAARYPAILDFATSSPVVSTVSRYLGFIPHLAHSQPRGIRLNESWREYDPNPGGPPKSSQMFHLDIHNHPLVYVIVPIREVTDDHGPFCFYPASASRRIAAALGWGRRGSPYRVTDERINTVAAGEPLQRFTAPAGTILYVDSSACFHYGSRNAAMPRYQMMFAYVSPCRADFSDVLLRQHRYPTGPGDSGLRRLLLDRYARD